MTHILDDILDSYYTDDSHCNRSGLNDVEASERMKSRNQALNDSFHPPKRVSDRTCAEIAKELEEKALNRKHRKSYKPYRYAILKAFNFRCCACGASPSDGETVLCIDHIKPWSKHKALRFQLDNLQVLCRSCNSSKSNNYEDDLRSAPPEE